MDAIRNAWLQNTKVVVNNLLQYIVFILPLTASTALLFDPTFYIDPAEKCEALDKDDDEPVILHFSNQPIL
jgi:hypothetical protein